MSAKGRCFYLDLVGKEDLTAQYQQELTRRGAVSTGGGFAYRARDTMIVSV